MKFELKTENENYSKSFSQFFSMVFFLTLIIILCDVALKLGIISRTHKIEFNCRILSVERTKPHFKKLSRISNLKSKQQIWEFCREVIKQ
jgi:flagellar biosynthesis protein FlhB